MPIYSFACPCGRITDQRHAVSSRPDGILCVCGSHAERIFVPNVNILLCPLSLSDQQERAHLEYLNTPTRGEIQKWEREQQAYADEKKPPERPSFESCLDDARRELTHRRIDYVHPTVPG